MRPKSYLSSQYENKVKDIEVRTDKLPANEERTNVRKLIDNVRTTLLQFDAAVEKHREIEQSLNKLIERVEDQLCAILSHLPPEK